MGAFSSKSVKRYPFYSIDNPKAPIQLSISKIHFPPPSTSSHRAQPNMHVRMLRPHETPPPPATPPSIDLPKHPLPKPDRMIWHPAYKPRMLLPPPRHPQPLHRAPIMLRADMALAAILQHHIPQPARHDKTRQRGRSTPVDIDAASDIVIVGFEVDEAAPAAGPV